MSALINKINRRLSVYIPKFYWHRYSVKAKKAGLAKLYFILSFDCDTLKDIEVIGKLIQFLTNIGIKATFAVPGQLLMKGETEYKKAAELGFDFINHGYYQHSFYRDGEYKSSYFYDQLSPEKIVEDIERGHDAIKDVFGKYPKGFRVPHFGTFQTPANFKFLHGILKERGYLYSTSSKPILGLQNGPILDKYSLPEIPVSGCFDEPFSILDSWSFRAAPNRIQPENQFKYQMISTIDLFLKKGWSGVLNYYVDPSQVYNFDGFYESISYVAENAVESLFYPELLNIVNK